MKFKIKTRVNSFDVDFRGEITLYSICRYFQQMAIYHSDSVGYTHDFFMEKGITWVLHKLYIATSMFPKYTEEIELFTWSRGAKKFFAYRDFLMRCKGDDVAKVSSVWLLLDVKRKRPLKVSDEMVERYTKEDDSVISDNIFKVETDENLSDYHDYEIRYHDYDTNGHLNNATYVSIVEDVYYREHKKKLKELVIVFQKEISVSISSIKCFYNDRLFSIKSDDTIHAYGKVAY